MAFNLAFDFFYYRVPRVALDLLNTPTGRSLSTQALLDTGAEVSLFDEWLAVRLGLDLEDAEPINVSGVGGEIRRARLGQVEVRLLEEDDLALTTRIAFAPNVEATFGNLIGLDVLEHFDFALSHGQRTGYLGRSES
jgi:hypothetical protein